MSQFYDAQYSNRLSAAEVLGNKTGAAVVWHEAFKNGHLDWEVIKKQLYARNPLNKVVALPVWGLFRVDTGEYLGNASESYEIIQNKDQFWFIDEFIGAASNGAHYETAGYLGRGEIVWCQARVPGADFGKKVWPMTSAAAVP